MEDEEYRYKTSIRIAKPDDSGDYYGQVELTSNENIFRGQRTHYINDYTKYVKSSDPIHACIFKWWKGTIEKIRSQFKHNYVEEIDIDIYGVPILLETNETNRILYLNGKAISNEHLANCLSRLTFKAIFTKNTKELYKTMRKYLKVHEDIRHVLENRLSYHFFNDFSKQEVKLNVSQISDSEYAVEVSDGIWGTMTARDLVSFCKYFLHGKKGSKWAFCSPNRLFKETVGRPPTQSEFELMIPFLLQNRTLNLIEDRAKELIMDMKKEYPDKIFLEFNEDNFLKVMYVRGKEFDWKLSTNYDRHRKRTGRQAVSTHYWNEKFLCKDELEKIQEEGLEHGHWQGPICIDNMSKDTPLGDQFAARAFACMNDSALRQMVHTVKSVLPSNPQEYHRFDFSEHKENMELKPEMFQ
tara:strand:+ start:313 stop:1548 length:1236 start_codon:yes stop_codon:yes gene_type:complete